MKKLLLLAVLLTVTAAAMTQDRALPSRERINHAVLVSADPGHPEECLNTAGIKNTFCPMLAPNEHDVGITVFDSPTNKLLAHRIYRYEDETIGVVWTIGMQDPDFPDRGTGYNYYNGIEWGPVPEDKIEDFRAGWPSYAALGNGGEMFFSHDFATGEVLFHTREEKGIGDWIKNAYTYSSGPPDGISHAKVITTGLDHNTIHLLVNSYAEYLGQSMAMLYSRSQDGGQTWDIQNVVLEGTGIDYYNGHVRDAFVLAEERGGAIALICGFPFGDLFIMKSTDNGDTWEKTVIWENPYPFFDWNVTITDTFFCMDNSASIALDAQGKVHVVFGINRVLHDTPGTWYWLWPTIDGIAYWNEDMETFSNDLHALAPPGLGYSSSEMILDYNYIGWMQDVNGNGSIDLNDDMFFYRQHGASTMPAITIDDQGRLFVIYSSTTETYEYEFYNYKHLWGRAFENGSWGPFIDLTESIAHMYDECIFPVLASSSDDFIYYIYHVDNTPGLAQLGDHGFVETRITYGALPKSDLLTGINDHDGKIDRSLRLTTYPNPAAGIINLSFSIENHSPVEARIINSQGLLIESINLGKRDEGIHLATLNLSHLPGGIYLLRLQAGEQAASAKIVLNK